MTSADPRDPLRQALERGAPAARYDVEVGLQRHRELVLQGAPVPEWAGSLGPARRFPTAWLLSALAGLGLLAVLLADSSAEHQRAPAALAVETPRAAVTVQVVLAPQVTALSEARAARTALPGPLEPLPGTPRQDSLAAAPRTNPSVVAPGEEPGSSRVAPLRAHAVRVASPPRAQSSLAAAAPEAAAPRGVEARGWAREQNLAGTPAAAPPDALMAELAAGRAVSAPTVDAPPLPEPTQRTPAPEAIDPEVLEEMQQLASAERLLPTMPSRTLSMVREGMQRFPHGYLAQERRYLEIMALLALRMPRDAALLSRGFLRDYPKGPYRRKIERALEEGARD